MCCDSISNLVSKNAFCFHDVNMMLLISPGRTHNTCARSFMELCSMRQSSQKNSGGGLLYFSNGATGYLSCTTYKYTKTYRSVKYYLSSRELSPARKVEFGLLGGGVLENTIIGSSIEVILMQIKLRLLFFLNLPIKYLSL